MQERATTETRVVPDGILCIGCGYELTGLPFRPESKCPECGLELEKTRVGPLLRYESREWLERTADGLRLLHQAMQGFGVFFVLLILIVVLVGLGMIVYLIFGWDYARSDAVDVLGDFSRVVVRVGFVIALGVMLVGVFRLSRPPEVLKPEGGNWRLWMLVGPFCLIGFIVIGAIENRGSVTIGWVRWAMSLSLVLTLVCAWISFIAMDRVLHELDSRCSGAPELDPLPKMTAKWIGWRVLVCLIVAALAFNSFSMAATIVQPVVLIAYLDLWDRVRVTRERVSRELDHVTTRHATIQPS